jgi:hypothetical protein
MSNGNELGDKLGDAFHIAKNAGRVLRIDPGIGMQAVQVGAIGTAALTAAAAVPVLWPVAAVAGLVWWLSKK